MEQQEQIIAVDDIDVVPSRISRRGFLKGVSALFVAAGVGGMAAGCEPAAQTPGPHRVATPIPVAQQYPEVPYPPTEPPAPGLLRFFTPDEAQTVEALTARILPGDASDPGAREAGVVYYIDNLLSEREGFAEKTYRQPPYAQTYRVNQAPQANGQTQGADQAGGASRSQTQDQSQDQTPLPTPPSPADDAPLQPAPTPTPPPQAGPYQVVWIPDDQIERYGYQSILSPREVYRIGVATIDSYAQQTFGRRYIELSEQQQDSIIAALLENRVTGFSLFSSKAFFHVLRRHTCEGMFSDPVYGGNRGMVGWKLIGYPGAQRAYTPGDIVTEGSPREPQSLAQMHRFKPGQPAGPNVVLPVSGSDEHRHGR